MNNYTVDETFFDELDSEVKNYVFGLWLADGCVDTNGRLRLQMADLDIIEIVKEEVKYSGPLRIINPPKPHHKIQYCLDINRYRLAKSLIDRGCPPNKSLILEFPTINEQFLKHMIRGYFDGDGSISTNLHNVSIVGTLNFCTTLSNILNDMNIDNVIYQRRGKESTTRQLFIKGQDNQYKFLKWIYKDATIYLERKYELYQQIIMKRIGQEKEL